MPDLSAKAPRPWTTRTAPGLSHLDRYAVRPIEHDGAVANGLAQLGAALRDGNARDHGALTASLAADPVPQLLSRILEQLGLDHMVQVMDRLVAMPEGRASVAALLSPDAEGQGLRDTLIELNRHASLARIYAPDRVEMLLAACRSTFQEQEP